MVVGDDRGSGHGRKNPAAGGSSMNAPPGVAPGWYPDPWVLADLRYFDGATWTSEVAPSAVDSATTRPGDRVAGKRSVSERLGIALAMVAAWLIVTFFVAALGWFVGFVRSLASDSDMDDGFATEMVRAAPFVGMIVAGLFFLAYLLVGRRG